MGELVATMAGVRAVLGDGPLDAAQRRGAAMAIHEALDFARGEIAAAVAASGGV